MPNIVLFDNDCWTQLLPLTFTKPSAELRVGILTIREKWEHYLPGDYSYFTTEYLREKYPFTPAKENIFISASLLPTVAVVEQIQNLDYSNALVNEEDQLLAFKYESADKAFSWIAENERQKISVASPVAMIQRPWDIFQQNAACIAQDFAILTAGNLSQTAHESNTLIGDQIYIHPSAEVLASTLNSTTGPIYIGENAKVMEGSNIRGPLALCENATIKMGTLVYGATTIGPHCKVGGELSNVVMQAYSNKGHGGFLGNAVIGEWCNLGAGTNASNLKNNYGEVKVWNYSDEKITETGNQFCGLIMGDHCKASINSMFNTGTVVGVASNIFGTGFPEKFVPSFSWGAIEKKGIGEIEKIFTSSDRMMKRRGKEMNKLERGILRSVFENTKKYRT